MSDGEKKLILLAVFWAPSLIVAAGAFLDVALAALRDRELNRYAKRIADGDKDIYTGH